MTVGSCDGGTGVTPAGLGTIMGTGATVGGVTCAGSTVTGVEGLLLGAFVTGGVFCRVNHAKPLPIATADKVKAEMVATALLDIDFRSSMIKIPISF